MQTLEFILSAFALIVVWRFVIRRTLLDHTRDQLFDIRDDLRRAYIKNGWSLASNEYKQARDLINAHLHFTESMSAWRIFALQGGMARDENLRRYVQNNFESMFAGVPEKQAVVVQKYRSKSLRVVTGYAITNSLVLVLLCLIMVPFVAIWRGFTAAKHGVSIFFDAGCRSIFGVGETLLNLLNRVAKLVMKPQAVEQCAVFGWSH